MRKYVSTFFPFDFELHLVDEKALRSDAFILKEVIMIAKKAISDDHHTEIFVSFANKSSIIENIRCRVFRSSTSFFRCQESCRTDDWL